MFKKKPEQRFWDKEMKEKKPLFTTSDIGEDVAEKARRDEIMEEAKKQKEKKDEKEKRD